MNLQNAYSRADFLKHVQGFIPGFIADSKPTTATGLQVTKNTFYLGESPDLDLSIFELTHLSTRDARVKLAMDGFRVMKAYGVFRALIVYRSEKSDDWRLSLMTATLSPSEKGKVTQTFSNPRRFSFFLGPNAKVNTPSRFLLKQGPVSNFEDLQKRFSLEVVNKEFYKGISESFTKLVGGALGSGKNKKTYEPTLRLPSKQLRSQAGMEFGVRLIGRIIFCWFLREKKGQNGISLMPRELLSSEAVRKYTGYYHYILEPIFFEVLNREHKGREEKWTSEPFSRIPYLNGGLFSPQYDDNYELDREILVSPYINTLVVPDAWIEEFFNLLESYNFTIDENTSFDEELSIDPEMLGRIFENLLAEINPETGESARKSTGSFYTPRAIVDYMVDESLLLFLQQKTNIKENKLRALISYDLTDDEKHAFSDTEKRKVVDALEGLKLLDPACGSGAFPIGALQKIVFILQRVDSDAQLWFAKQIVNTAPEIRRVIEREFKHKNFDYIRKLGVIRENIYGVDIQPIAIEISRLRCFLTLVVDERIDDALPNRGIEPLPNLDFKFVAANSLLGLKNEQTATEGLFKDQDGINRLKAVRDRYFTATNSERHRLQNEFSAIQKQMLDRMIQLGGKSASDDTTRKLSLWEPFSNKASDWFDPEWMFGIESGFDIIIANPPYIDSETMVKEQPHLRQQYAQTYSTATGNWDLYIPFLQLGVGLLAHDGVSSFITPNKWYAIGYGKGIRKLLTHNIYRIANCNSVKVFEAGNSPVVTIYGKTNDATEITVDLFDENYVIKTSVKVKADLLGGNLGMALADFLETVLSIRNKHTPLGEYLSAENPCSVSEAYEIKELIHELPENEESIYFRFVNTGTIDPFVSLWGQKNTTYLKTKYRRPVINKEKFKDRFPRRYTQSTQPKLVVSGMRHFESFLDLNGKYVAGKSTEILVDKSGLDLKVALAVLNSNTIRFYIKQVYGVLGIDGGINFTTDLIESLPFPLADKRGQKILVNLVDKVIQNSTEEQKKMPDYENQIDKLVYKLYGLTPAEIKIVENNGK